MAAKLVPGEDDQAAIMACIGNVCIQWSLLEQNILAVLAACQNIHLSEAAILFGGLDMKPRLGMAINLAEHHRWHPLLLRRLRALRTNIDKSKLVDRRNLIVHGVHSASEGPQAFSLYTPRRKGDAQREEWTVMDAYRLGIEIQQANLEAYEIFLEYGRWKFPDHFTENTGREVVAAPPRRVTRIKQYIRARLHNVLW